MNREILEILVCPVCKGKLFYNKKDNELVCKADRLAYPIREEIPVMLEPEARRLTSEEVQALESAFS